MEIERVITPYGEVKIYVVAPADMHHSTILSAVVKYLRALPQPDYMSLQPDMTRKAMPGKWCTPPQYSGEWKQVYGTRYGAPIQDTTPMQRKTFTAWPVPDYSHNTEGE